MRNYNQAELADNFDSTHPSIKDQPMTLPAACAFLGISRSHMYKLTSRGEIPHYSPTGKTLYFRASELLEWVYKTRRGMVNSNGEAKESANNGGVRS